MTGSEGVTDETLAVVVVVTGVLVLSGSTALHVVWLVLVGLASTLGVLRETATRRGGAGRSDQAGQDTEGP